MVLEPDHSSESSRDAAPPVATERAGWRRGFWSLFITQFQGAFSDNVFKFLVIFLLSDRLEDPSVRNQYISVVLAVFSLPFILFSMTGGYLADRFPKRSVVIGTKLAEVVVMSLGTLGLAMQSLPVLVGVIFLMSVQSAFFGPAKYSLLPEMLPVKRLSWGNGLLSLGTFMAIITGGVVGGVLYETLGERQTGSGLLLVALAGLGLIASLGILKLPAANPSKVYRLNFLSDLLVNLRLAGRDRVLTLAIAGSVYFWFLGALFGEPTIFVYSKDLLELSETNIALLRACLAIGIAVGSAAAGFLSARKIEVGLIPLGAFGLAVFAAMLAVPGLSAIQVAVLLGLLGFSGGFYIVPINALIQHRPDAKDKGSIIAANAWLTSLGVFLASGAFWVLGTALRLQPTTIFLIGALATFAGTIFAIKLMPDSLLRLLLWIITHTVYRVRVEGRDNIPERGGALFVCNHLSLIDGVLLQASTDRPVRFIMFKGIYERRWVKPYAKIMRAIPISSELRPREMLESLKTARDAILNGEVVCIFAEGQITRIGQLLPFRRGFEKIMKGVEAPIVPVCLDGVWGSIFSYEKGRFLSKLPRRIPFPVTVFYGKPMPGSATHIEVRQAVQELNTEAWTHRRRRMRTLDLAFIYSARRFPFRRFMADARTARLNFASALTRAVFLARRLNKVWRGQRMVGVFLPPTIPGALVNWAALLAGRVPVNLNYTVSQSTLESCCQQCELKTVVTSKAFLDQVKLSPPGEIILLEELAKNPGFGEKLIAFLMSWLLPDRWLVRLLRESKQRVKLDDLATVIFSSGSTGDPKGVMLSHYNVVSNIEQLGQTFALDRRDCILGVLPFFHSFGFTGTLGLPGVLGVGAVYHPNPLDAKTIGELVERHAVTFVLATPTFLQLYMRSCSAEQFGSVQLLMVGAEKLPDRLAEAFEEKFGIRPVEGYGCTECAPAVTVNTRDFRAAGFRQIGAKRGRIGHPLPGVSVKIVDPESHQPLAVGQSGLLLVRGPNVMTGYLGRPEKTAEVLKPIPLSPQRGEESGAKGETGEFIEATAKWYITGDIAALDEDGFLVITDRLSRFSKIGGEMVPHIKVEEKLHELAGIAEQTFAVASVPDEKKGERLLVLHKLDEDKLESLLAALASADLPNLWKPRKDQFFRVEALPYLGTGKLDLKRIKELAAEFSTTTA